MKTMEKYAKYAKMQKAGLPEGAVRGKMRMDGLEEDFQDAFFAGEPEPEKAPTHTGPPLRTRAKYAKYAKMQKAGLPEGAVRGKMRMDGVSDAQQDAFFEGLGEPAPGKTQGKGKAAGKGKKKKRKKKNAAKAKPRVFRTFFWSKIDDVGDARTVWHGGGRVLAVAWAASTACPRRARTRRVDGSSSPSARARPRRPSAPRRRRRPSAKEEAKKTEKNAPGGRSGAPASGWRRSSTRSACTRWASPSPAWACGPRRCGGGSRSRPRRSTPRSSRSS